MSAAPQLLRIGYFGKIAACADFIRAPGNPALANRLDGWLAEVMNLLSAEPRWKIHYDALRPLHFAFVGTRSRRAVAGHLVASSDQSQRRYPFLAMTMLDIAQPERFLPRSPVVLEPLWRELALLVSDVTGASDPHSCLQAVAHAALEAEPAGGRHEQQYQDFLRQQDLAGLEQLLARMSVRRMILAVGLLLQPVPRQGAARPDRSLVLPLPSGLHQRALVAAFWLDLVACFLGQADYELALFLAEIRQQPVLVIGFAGAAPETLQAIIDPHYAAQQMITLEHLDWVDPLVAEDVRVHQLSACLAQGQLSLQAVRDLFHHTFA